MLRGLNLVAATDSRSSNDAPPAADCTARRLRRSRVWSTFPDVELGDAAPAFRGGSANAAVGAPFKRGAGGPESSRVDDDARDTSGNAASRVTYSRPAS